MPGRDRARHGQSQLCSLTRQSVSRGLSRETRKLRAMVSVYDQALQDGWTYMRVVGNVTSDEAPTLQPTADDCFEQCENRCIYFRYNRFTHACLVGRTHATVTFDVSIMGRKPRD